MFIFLLVLCVLPVCSLYDGMCPRKDPPPGVVVVSPGTRLVLTCSGHVKVNGVKVILNSSNVNKRRPTSVRITKSDQTPPVDEKNFSPTAVSSEHEENLTDSDTELTFSPLIIHPTTGESDWEDEEVDSDDDYEDEEEEEGSRVTRGIKQRPQWKWNNQLVQKGDRNRGEVTFMSHGAALCLESVRVTDAGKYSCHHRGTETFAVKVVVADPPESPRLSCYKKFPSGKIRCEWRPQKPIARPHSCYLLLKRNSDQLHQVPCSFSSDRCWCSLEHNEDELRTLHVASLCVTGIMGNATSAPLYFKPLDMLKPDPPSNVSAHKLEQQEKKIKVTWNLPLTWKESDNFYRIIYEIRYRLSTSVNSQVNEVKGRRSFTITDALAGVEYLIELRTKEEFDGQWSEWSSPVYARSWTAEVVKTDYSTTPMFDSTILDDLGSGFPDDNCPDGPGNYIKSENPLKLQHHVVLVFGLFAVTSVILAVYIFRHKDKVMSKSHKLHLITCCGDVPPPSPPTPAPGSQALVNFAPQPYKEQPPSDTQEEEKNEEEQAVMDRTEAMNFNNTSYFLLQEEI